MFRICLLAKVKTLERFMEITETLLQKHQILHNICWNFIHLQFHTKQQIMKTVHLKNMF
jgi:hypothetical protein